MFYRSSRSVDSNKKYNFRNIAISGVDSDGGLYFPESIPTFSQDEINRLPQLSYKEIAKLVIPKFVGDSIDQDDLCNIIDETYDSAFTHTEIAPLIKVDKDKWVMELFHGPTLAFKDYALQFVGNLASYILKDGKTKSLVVGATSGDTGSAAIHAFRDIANLKMFIMHPYNSISEVQRKQMTTVISDHVFNIALKGSFDDAQNCVKDILLQEYYADTDYKLMAVNSINWGRIIAQIVYYCYACSRVGTSKKVKFFVPTGNFGNILAGYIAKNMGLPISSLVISTNENDLLHRFLQSNLYQPRKLKRTNAPSMDIQISSNFERLIYDLSNHDGGFVREKFVELQATGSFSLPDDIYHRICNNFRSYRVTEAEIEETILRFYNDYNMTLCPHTATAAYACDQDKEVDSDSVSVILATAHPAKFESVYEDIGVKLDQHPTLMKLKDMEERYDIIENDLDQLNDYIEDRLEGNKEDYK